MFGPTYLMTTIKLSSIMISLQTALTPSAQAEMTSTSASSFGGSSAPPEPAESLDAADGDDDEMMALEMQVDEDLAAIVASGALDGDPLDDDDVGVVVGDAPKPLGGPASLAPSADTASPSPVAASPSPAASPSTAKPGTLDKHSPATAGNLAKALMGGGGVLTPSALSTPELEAEVEKELGSMEEEDLERMVSEAKQHFDFQSYVDGVNEELGPLNGEGDGDEHWGFGEQEPYYDVVGFEVWKRARANMRKALGIPSPPQPTPQALPPPQPNAPAATKPNAAVAAAHPPKPNAAVAAAHPPKPNAAVAAAHPPKPDAAVAATHPPKPDAAIAATHPPKRDAAVAATHPPMPNAAVAAAHPPMPKAAVAAAHPPNPDAGASNPPEADASMPPPPVPVPKAAPSPSQLNAVVDGAAAETANRALPNSVSNRAEYMQYLRAARNPSKMVKSLIPGFQGNKLDLFRIWLEKGQDFQQVAIEVRRRNAQKQTAAAKDKCMSRKDLEACGRYTESDIQELIARKTAEGLYINDPNFPNREDLRQYRVNTEVSHEIAHSREDSQEMVSNTSLNPTEALALTEEGADFSTTAMPSMNEVLQVGGNSGGGGGIHGDTAEAPAGKAKAKAKTKAKAKAKPGDNTSDPPPDKPQTPLDKAMALKKIVFLGSCITNIASNGELGLLNLGLPWFV